MHFGMTHTSRPGRTRSPHAPSVPSALHWQSANIDFESRQNGGFGTLRARNRLRAELPPLPGRRPVWVGGPFCRQNGKAWWCWARRRVATLLLTRSCKPRRRFTRSLLQNSGLVACGSCVSRCHYYLPPLPGLQLALLLGGFAVAETLTAL